MLDILIKKTMPLMKREKQFLACRWKLCKHDFSISDIYKFENFGAKGEYRAIINKDELNRDENSQNHTFMIPYYQNFSADLGNDAKLKSNSSGMLIATQRELPNDYGVLGIYTGFENAE